MAIGSGAELNMRKKTADIELAVLFFYPIVRYKLEKVADSLKELYAEKRPDRAFHVGVFLLY